MPHGIMSGMLPVLFCEILARRFPAHRLTAGALKG